MFDKQQRSTAAPCFFLFLISNNQAFFHGIKAGQTSKDLLFSLDGLRCVGACGIAPVVVVNGKVYGNVTVDQVSDILDHYRKLDLDY